MEISSVGRFFKGPDGDIGFVDIAERINKENIPQRLVEARLAPWSLNNRIYGLPSAHEA